MKKLYVMAASLLALLMIFGAVSLTAGPDEKMPLTTSSKQALDYYYQGRDLAEMDEISIRQAVAEYCLAQVGKPYNINFLNPDTERAFYCSQLAYKAYLPHGIDLNTDHGVPHIIGSHRIVFPNEIWSGCQRQRAG